MKEFFASMDATQQFYWYVAIGASVIFIIQTIMTFVGADTDTGGDADFDGNFDGDHPFQLFSLRNLINFLLGFGWTGALLYASISSSTLLGIVAVLVGTIFIALFFMVMKAIMKLGEDNTFNIADVVGKTAEVYLNIPAGKQGKGKVFVSVKGATHELSAMTTSVEDIKSGLLVKVDSIDGDILLVSPLTK